MERAEYVRMAEQEDRHWWYRSTRALLDQLIGGRLVPGCRVLDIGAGTGATGAWMGERGSSYVAADFEPLALELHRDRHPRSELAVADVLALPFADASFDVVAEVTVLCHRSIADPARAVREMARVVRPGGIVLLWEPGGEKLRRSHDRETHSARRFSRSHLAELLVTAGLTVERSTGAYSFLLPAAAAMSAFDRGSSSSDLDRQPSGLGGVLPALASLERRLLRRVDLPAGLSVVAVARRA